MTDPSTIIATYICAKDGNRPWLMRQAFTTDSVLKMDVKSKAISFPALTQGIEDMTYVLVRSFARDYENVYTFCLTDPPAHDAQQFSCDWLVAMSGKQSGDLRVGCGRYDWVFGSGNTAAATDLKITISHMQIFDPEHIDAAMTWVSALPYPWCQPEQAVRDMPKLAGLGEIARYIEQIR